MMSTFDWLTYMINTLNERKLELGLHYVVY